MRRDSEKRRRPGASFRALAPGFTIVELVTVMVVIGILGAVGASRFFDNSVFEGRAYADQAKSMIRYAQKLAIAQNRFVFVRATPASFAVCFTANCGNAAALAFAPGGSNSGSAATRAACVLGGGYVANWMCEGRPANVAVASTAPHPAMDANGFFFFDRTGRPFNVDANGVISNFGPLSVSFTSGASVFRVTVEAETGYVH